MSVRTYVVDQHESVNLPIEKGTVIVIDTDEELLDIYTALVLVRGIEVVSEKLLPQLRAAVLGKKQPETVTP